LDFTRERAALDWAMTQANFGNTLFRLGERESGMAQYDEAVSGYHESLREELTRERAPLEWAHA
jgi:hypothetical protein